jgi:hypothetical protein
VRQLQASVGYPGTTGRAGSLLATLGGCLDELHDAVSATLREPVS